MLLCGVLAYLCWNLIFTLSYSGDYPFVISDIFLDSLLYSYIIYFTFVKPGK